MYPTVVAYYTLNTGYVQEFERLARSVRELDLPFYFKGIPTLGSWQKNTQYKVEFLRECLKEIKKPIMYVDADAEIKHKPDLLLDEVFTEDIALHEINWEVYKPWDKRFEMVSGTLALRPTDATFRFLDLWQREISRIPDLWEQRCMEIIIRRMIPEGTLSVRPLPATYCKIFDLMASVQDPVVLHHQASRRLKAKVGIV